MKIAIAWNRERPLRATSFPFEQFRLGFETLGHEAFVLARRADVEDFPEPLETFEELAELRDPGFWRRLAADVVMIITWHRMPEVLEAIQQGGSRVLAYADSDGRIGLRVHPWHTLQRMIYYARGWRGKAGCVKYWLGRYLREGGASTEDEMYLASTRSSDVVAVPSTEARRHLLKFLAYRGAPDLGRRVISVPYTLAAPYLSCPLAERKADRVIAIGRWDDPQKDTRLLARALTRFLSRRPATEVVIFGAEGERWFVPLAARFASLSYRGVQPQEEVAGTLSGSRAVLVSSRWESGPLVALEGLALGTTVVGTPIPSLISWCDGGRFGTVASSPRPASLARALSREMAAWDEGERRPEEISRHWRDRLSPRAACQRLLEALPPG